MRRALVTTVSLAALVACAGATPPPPTTVIATVSATDAGPPPLSARHDATCKAITFSFDDSHVEPVPSRSTIESREGREGADACTLADDNVGSAEQAVLLHAADARPSAPAQPWDHRADPAYLKEVDRRFHLTAGERTTLKREGFMVSERLDFSTYAWAFHELYQSQVPLYVSADAILHAVYVSNDKLIEAIETNRVRPLLGQVLDALHCALADAANAYPQDVARDLDVYLTVARSLLADGDVKSVLGTDAEAAKLIAMARDGQKLEGVNLFGRLRHIDFSAYTPRGHYTKELAPFFRAAMWVSRVEFNMASRTSRSSYLSEVADPSETPREATCGIALADLAERAKAMDSIDLLDQVWGLLAGRREDISIRELSALRKTAGVTQVTLESATQVRAAIGDGYKRRARIHPSAPIGSGELPAISTLLGPRIVPDTTALRPLVDDAIPARYMIGDGDIGYALGHDRAKRYTSDASSPAVEQGLAKARAIVNEPLSRMDLYSTWFGAIRSLARKPEGTVPSFMATAAFEDMRLNSAMAAFGQIRHNYVLIAGQAYGGAGCEIPDGYVEPVPEVYENLIGYADRGAKVMAVLDPQDALGSKAYFGRLAKTLKVLRTIAQDELAGRALTADEKRFVAMVAEYDPPGSGGGPYYTGWYFDMFRDREIDGLMDADFVADYYTDSHDEVVAYAGATRPRLGFFVVDTGGAPRLMVGPVARGYVYSGPISDRLTDEKARAVKDKRDPWAASYTAAQLPEPPLSVKQRYGEWTPPEKGAETLLGPVLLEVKSSKALGPVTVELLDHHRLPINRMTLPVGARLTKFQFAPKRVKSEGIHYEAVHVKIGAFETVFTPFLGAMGPDEFTFQLGGMAAPEPPAAQ